MLDFFAILFIIFLLGAIISLIGLCITKDAPWGVLICVFWILAFLCGIGMECSKEPEVEKCECQCICCEMEEEK